jgi:hypothetical protein
VWRLLLLLCYHRCRHEWLLHVDLEHNHWWCCGRWRACCSTVACKPSQADVAAVNVFVIAKWETHIDAAYSPASLASQCCSRGAAVRYCFLFFVHYCYQLAASQGACQRPCCSAVACKPSQADGAAVDVLFHPERKSTMAAAIRVWRLLQASATGGVAGVRYRFSLSHTQIHYCWGLAESFKVHASDHTVALWLASQARLTRLPSMCSSIVTWKSTLTAASGAWLIDQCCSGVGSLLCKPREAGLAGRPVLQWGW